MRRLGFLRLVIILLAAVLVMGTAAGLGCGLSAPTPTALPTPTLGTSSDDLPGLDELLRARVAEYEAARGAGGQSATPEMVSIAIAATDDASGREIMDFITSRGATSVRNEGVGTSNVFADVPASLLRPLSERIGNGIDYMKAYPLPYPRMDAGLNGLAVRYAAGLMPDEDTNPTFATLAIYIDGSSQGYDAIKQFLIDGGSVMAYNDEVMRDAYKPIGMLVAYAPVRLFAELHDKIGILEIDHEQYPVPAEERITDDGGPYPAGDSRINEKGVVRHGARAWHNANYRGHG